MPSLTQVKAGAETAWHKLDWEDVTMLNHPTVPHAGIYMPAEIRHLRKVVRKIMASEPTSSRSEETSVGIARRVFDAYNWGIVEMEELLLLGEMEKHRLIDRDFPGEQEADA